MCLQNGELVIISKRSKEWFFSIRWRLVLTYFIIILLTLSFISIYIRASLEEYFFNQEEIELLTKANVIANITSRYVEYKDESIKETIEDLQLGKGIRVIITNKEANVLFDTEETGSLKDKVLLKEEVVNALNTGKDDAQRYFEEEAGWILSAAVPMIKERETVGVVYLSTSAEEIINFLEDIKQKLFVISFMMSIFIGLFSAVLARIITAPVENLTAVIKNMPDGNLNQRVAVRGKDEIAQLGKAFNKMSKRLNEVEEKRKEFVSNASHELKTPLSSIKVLTQSLLQMEKLELSVVKEFLSDINHEIDRLTRIINKLLILTRTDVGEDKTDMKKMNLKELIAGVFKGLLPLAHEKNIKLELKAEQDVFFVGDEDKIWESIFNIVDNSIKYTPPDGRVTLTLEEKNDTVVVVIEDNGIGMPPAEVNKIFDRFYRIDKARARETGGTGLGLSIALSGVTFHGGDIQVESEEGKGSKFIIRFPIKLGKV